MKHPTAARLLSITLALMLGVLPVLAIADTYLPDGDVTHVDFTMDLALHADGFPQSKAHLNDWETFLSKLGIRGSMDMLAMFTPYSRVYMDAALLLNGKDQVPFVYDGYHSYRYLVSPMFNGEALFFQMHNFLEFMLKPYFYMELPTQYLALLMYPEASYYIGDSYYTPVRDMLTAERENAVDQWTANGATAPVNGENFTYTIPYERLYELCETLDLIVTSDVDMDRAYFYFTSLLTDFYASDMTLEILGALEDILDALDPNQLGMTVVETPESLTLTIGETQVFAKTSVGGVTHLRADVPTPSGYEVVFDYLWDATGEGALLSANLTITSEGEKAIVLTADGTGLPREGDLNGAGQLTLGVSGRAITDEVSPLTLAFRWSRDGVTMPYSLDVAIDWLHPQTNLPAITLHGNGTVSASDKSVFVDAVYPQDDFFNLNESFLNDYKERYGKTIAMMLAPILLETPLGVINDMYQFLSDTDILVSLIE